MPRTIINATKEPIVVRTSARRPQCFGTQEIVFPAPNATLPPRELVQMKDEDASIVLSRHGARGIVEVMPGDTLQDAILRGLNIRHDMLVGMITAYRETQAMRQAGGLGVQLPREHHRKALREIAAIEKEVLELDPVLAADLSSIRSAAVPDPMAKDLEAMGINPAAMAGTAAASDSFLGL